MARTTSKCIRIFKISSTKYEQKLVQLIQIIIKIHLFIASTGAESCSNAYELTIGAVIATYYPEVEGIYDKVCDNSSGWPLYKRRDGNEIMYFFGSSTSGAWLISDGISATPKVIRPTSPSGVCPGEESGTPTIAAFPVKQLY